MEKDFAGFAEVGYAWTEKVGLIPKTPIGVNLRFYHNATDNPDADDKIVGKGHVKCLLQVYGNNGVITIQADPESAVGKLGAPVLNGTSVDFMMQCRATIGRGALVS